MSVTGLQGSPDAFNHKESMFRTVTISEKWRRRARGILRIFRKEPKKYYESVKNPKSSPLSELSDKYLQNRGWEAA